MKCVELTGLGVPISRLGYGSWQLGGHGWGKVSQEDMVRAIRKALDCGMTFFDTAPVYGLGRSEEILGEVLGRDRHKVVLATKTGFAWKTGTNCQTYIDNSPKNIRREIDQSLKRLRTDYIDLYQIHWPDDDTPIEDTIGTMEELRKAGKIRAIGCCNFPLSLLKEASQYGNVQTIQVPYNLIDRSCAADILPYCKDRGIAVLSYGPTGRGLLTGKYDCETRFGPDDHRSRSGDKYFSGEAFLRHLATVEKVKAVAQRMGCAPAQVAIRWVLQNPCVTTALFGAKTAQQVEENVSAADMVLRDEDLRLLEKEV